MSFLAEPVRHYYSDGVELGRHSSGAMAGPSSPNSTNAFDNVYIIVVGGTVLWLYLLPMLSSLNVAVVDSVYGAVVGCLRNPIRVRLVAGSKRNHVSG